MTLGPGGAIEHHAGLGDPQPGGRLALEANLAADVSGGNRPSFSGAAPPEIGRRLYERVLATARAQHAPVEAGVFGADMQVSLVNDGPVTIPITWR